MYRGGFRTGWIAGAAVFGAVCGIGTQALASGSYSVHLAVPRTVVTGHEFRVTAAGAASQKAHLTVFLAALKCKASAKAEATAGVKIIAKTVVHSYSSSQTEKASAPGKQYACYPGELRRGGGGGPSRAAAMS
jgi:hypothetical protein